MSESFPVTLSEKAAAKILQIMKKEDIEDAYLRVAVKGGGCSGYQYVLDFDRKQNDYDLNINVQYNVKVVIDEMSAQILVGTTVDYVDSLMESGFKFLNEAAKKTCGCGKSFST